MIFKPFLKQLPISVCRRHYSSKSEGIKYWGFTYYPRFPDHKDPPYEPTKLFMVQRIKPVKGTPYWERKILEGLGLLGRGGDLAIVKNIPENNARLYKIKHLIKITPITFPNGPPSESDFGATYLKENGELVVSPTVKVDDTRLQASETFEKDKLKLDGNTLKRQLRLQWLNPW